MNYYSIAIDGPAGSGKSTVAKKVASDLGFEYVNSGLLYRAIAVYIDEKRIDYMNEYAITQNVMDCIKLVWDRGTIFLNENNVTNEAKQSQYAKIASVIAQYQIVRDFVNKNILDLSKIANVVVDGRDIGSKVLPNATVKIFLEADIRTRAIRRLKEDSKYTNSTLDINEVINGIIERDNRDYTRTISPLVKTEDAVVIDSSELTVDETCEAIKRAYMRRATNAEWKD